MKKFLTFLAVFSAMKSMAVHPQFKADLDSFIETHLNRSVDFQSAEFRKNLDDLSVKFNEYSAEELRENLEYFRNNLPYKSEFFVIRQIIFSKIYIIIGLKELLNEERIVEIVENLEKSENCESDWEKNFDALFFFDKNVLEKITFNQDGKNYAFLTRKLQSLIEIKEMETQKDILEHFLNSIKEEIAKGNFVVSDQRINDVLSKNLPSMKQILARIIEEEKYVEKYKNLIDQKYFQLLELQENLLTKLFQSEKEENNYTLKRKAIETAKTLLGQKENFDYVTNFAARMIEKFPTHCLITNTFQGFLDTIIKDCEKVLTEAKTFIQTTTPKLFGREIIENQTYTIALEGSRAKLAGIKFEAYDKIREEIAKLLPILEKLSEDIARSNNTIKEIQTEIARLGYLVEIKFPIEYDQKTTYTSLKLTERQYLALQERAKSINPSNPDESFVQKCKEVDREIDTKTKELNNQKSNISQNIVNIKKIITYADFVPVAEGAQLQEKFNKILEIKQTNIQQISRTKSQLQWLKSQLSSLKRQFHIEDDITPKPTRWQYHQSNTPEVPTNPRSIEEIARETEIARTQREYLATLEKQHLAALEQQNIVIIRKH